ncbi:TadE/TadG family type IV pilus assembly protein [Pseudacidovorax intermedius]|uniref:TadE/TadG family type IV pilus assembly protein n=1 Tax=Pseudacidovorax intermedius TaxID=433924 RepID=UPI0009DB80D8|nr:TadE/TadG family type IV pilus assembly protein [Pseudacidovorax intermedius]
MSARPAALKGRLTAGRAEGDPMRTRPTTPKSACTGGRLHGSPARARRVRHRRPSQQGVAALEFVMVCLALLFCFYGLTTFGLALYTRQALSRATEDGARMVGVLPAFGSASAAEQLAALDAIRNAMLDSLAGSLITPLSQSGSTETRRRWIADTVRIEIAPAAPTSTLTLAVYYPYATSGVFPAVPLLTQAAWIPEQLSSQAVVALPPR